MRQAVILASGLGHPGLPAPLARRHRGLRDRPAPGDRLQDRHAGRPRRHPDRASAARSPSTCATTGPPRCAQGGFDVDAADGVERRRAAAATCRPKPRTGCSTTSPALSAPGSRLATEHVPDPNGVHRRARYSTSPTAGRQRRFRPKRGLTCSIRASAASSSTTWPPRLAGDGPPRQGAVRAQRVRVSRTNELAAAFGDLSYVGRDAEVELGPGQSPHSQRAVRRASSSG